MNEEIPDAVEQRPWTEADGPEPDVHIYPHESKPGLYIKSDGKWLRAVVDARHIHPDRGVSYQCSVSLGTGANVARTYQWGQPGVRYAYGPDQGRLPDD
ncbi:hypothetical protein [Streptomyces sp. NPDC059258]|uniref:hypothetical protein n=1 Tax=unclassified Streptomyces TaxID=2593676 RepID=UPI0036C9FCD6